MAETRQQNSPTQQSRNPRFAADRKRSPPQRKNGRDHPTSGSHPRLPTGGTFGANKKPNQKAKPTDSPFSMAFEISDKKAMEKGQGMRR
jgi:hypothetical protein